MIGIHQFARLLSNQLNVVFPQLKCCVYASRRREYVHLCLNEPFWTITDHDAIIEHIRNFQVHGLMLQRIINTFFLLKLQLPAGSMIT